MARARRKNVERQITEGDNWLQEKERSSWWSEVVRDLERARISGWRKMEKNGQSSRGSFRPVVLIYYYLFAIHAPERFVFAAHVS